MREIRIQGKLRRNEILIFLAGIGGAYALGMILSIVMERAGTFYDVGEGMAFGWILSMAPFIMIYVLGMMISFAQDFNVAIGMGQTRREFLAGWIVITVIELAVCAVFYYLLGFAEKAVLAWAAPDVEITFSMPGVVQWYHIAGVAIGLLVWVLFGGALLLKVGMKMMWVLWAVIIFVSVVPANLAENEKVQQSFDSVGIFSGGALTGKGIAAAGLALCTVLLFAALGMLRKQKVSV